MQVTVLTFFPEMILQALEWSIPGRAIAAGQLNLKVVSWRDFGVDKHGNVDDTPYGGGPGMILRVDVADRALKSVDPGHQNLRILLSPDGVNLQQSYLKKTALEKRSIVLLSGRYEGFDARILTLIDQRISIGPYVLSGGELPATVFIDGLARLLPGVLGNSDSLNCESYNDDLSDYPQYTRPDEYKGLTVPEVLKSGNHQLIEKWRREHQSRLKTIDGQID